MSLRKIKNITEELLNESHFETVVIPYFNNREVTVYKNPSTNEILKAIKGNTKFADLRFLWNVNNNDLYIWNGIEATHGDILKNTSMIPRSEYVQGMYDFAFNEFTFDEFNNHGNKGIGKRNIDKFNKSYLPKILFKLNT